MDYPPSPAAIQHSASNPVTIMFILPTTDHLIPSINNQQQPMDTLTTILVTTSIHHIHPILSIHPPEDHPPIPPTHILNHKHPTACSQCINLSQCMTLVTSPTLHHPQCLPHHHHTSWPGPPDSSALLLKCCPLLMMKTVFRLQLGREECAARRRPGVMMEHCCLSEPGATRWDESCIVVLNKISKSTNKWLLWSNVQHILAQFIFNFEGKCM